MAQLAFGTFVLDTQRRMLFRNGVPQPATPKTLELLEFLATRANEEVTKHDIVDNVWRGESVSDGNIAQHILMLRKLLGEERGENRYILTVPKVGYRFVSRIDKEPAAVPALGPPVHNEEAFRAYCHGQYLLQLRTWAGLTDAARWFERATLLDPAFAQAYAGLATATIMLGIYMHVAPDEAFPRARAAGARALELAPDLADGHIVLGDVSCYFENDWQSALASYERAIALRPGSASAHHSLAWFFVCRGHLAQALSESAIALSLEPSSLTIAVNCAIILTYEGRNREAAEQLSNVLQLNPEFSLGHFFHAYALFGDEDYEAALNELLFVRGFHIHTLSLEGECHARSGRLPAAHRCLADLLAAARLEYVSPCLLARLYVALDDRERALDMLEVALHAHVAWTPIALVDPAFAPLKTESRFKAIENAIRTGRG
jgi:DNA-binding winged helix-turn-helix (wHTH) protein